MKTNRYKIIQPNQKIFFVKAVKTNNGYSLWYKKNKFWDRWIFIAGCSEKKLIKSTILYHLGLGSKIVPVSFYWWDIPKWGKKF